MSLIISLGSNLGERENNLGKALELLQKYFKLKAKSSICETEPVDYLEQPKFLNQLIEFELPSMGPFEILKITQGVEKEMGRVKNIPKGPRNIDVDILFLGFQKVKTPELEIPHHAWSKRPFNLQMLQDLNFFQKIQNNFASCDSFESFIH
ncbi:MAG: 2-amino-4-hydroxy-6-hydroxymethyldihydropteridine diphosphokinase [Bacteriovoracaceae bacterium]